MKERLLFFLKQFATLLCWLCVAISCIGATTTGDGFFITTGVVGLITMAVAVYNFINNQYNKRI